MGSTENKRLDSCVSGLSTEWMAAYCGLYYQGSGDQGSCLLLPHEQSEKSVLVYAGFRSAQV